jgi:hypothetical protein
MNLNKISHVVAGIILAFALIALLLATSNCLAATPEISSIPKSISVVMDNNYPPYVFKDN